MAYYKLVSGDAVLDAINDEKAQWIVENPNSYSIYNGQKEKAIGILGTDGGTVYHLHGKPAFHEFPDFVTVMMEEITESEYQSVIEDIAAGKILVSELEQAEKKTPDQTQPMTALKRLQDRVEELLQEKLPDPVDNSLEGTMERKIKEMSAACNAAITSGCDAMMADGELHHFSLTVEDQLNLVSLQALIALGQTTIPYHADGEECRYFSAEEFASLVQAATEWKLYHESYFNNLRAWIRTMDDVRDINSVQYGDEIPAEMYTDVMKGITEA